MGLAKFLCGITTATLLAGTHALARPDGYAAIKSVAVVSTLGSDVDLIATSDFGSGEHFPLHAKADFSGYLIDHIKATISGRFTVLPLGIDPALFRSYEDTETFRKSLVAAFQATPDTTPDAVILIHSATIVQDAGPIRALTFSYSGFSLTHSEGGFNHYASLLSAEYAVSIIDTKTGKEIGAGKSLLPAAGIFGMRPDAVILCDNKIWPSDPKAPTDTETTQIETDLMAVVAMSLPNALAAANLVPKGDDTRLTQWEGRPTLCKPFD